MHNTSVTEDKILSVLKKEEDGIPSVTKGKTAQRNCAIMLSVFQEKKIPPNLFLKHKTENLRTMPELHQLCSQQQLHAPLPRCCIVAHHQNYFIFFFRIVEYFQQSAAPFTAARLLLHR